MNERPKIQLLVLGAVLVLVGGSLVGSARNAGLAVLTVPPGLLGVIVGWAVILHAARLPADEPAPVEPGRSPVRLSAQLDAPLSRWRWLVKWLLVIPHAVVLSFLGVAFIVLTLSAFVAILVRGRYPAGAFATNVGILRWGWRVAYYSYSALGTDRYPPFSLRDADYPAHLDIAYPERLSPGLSLVKWWLLAIPQYVVLGVFSGTPRTGGGLAVVLVLFAGVSLLFTGRYPVGIFDLVIGLQRWMFRTIAYASLMTDVYPPFRLDQGGEERAEAVAVESGRGGEPYD